MSFAPIFGGFGSGGQAGGGGGTPPPSPVFSNVMLLIDEGAHGSTSFTDLSTGGVDSPHAASALGNAVHDNGSAPPISDAVTSILHDGTGDGVDAGDSNDFDLGGADYGMDLWFKTSADGVLLSKYDFNNQRAFLFWVNGNVLAFNSYGDRTSSSNFLLTVTGVTTVTDDAWHHALVNYDFSARTFYLFLDGDLEASPTHSDQAEFQIDPTTSPVRVGITANDGIPLNGRIAYPRLWINEVVATASFTKPTAPPPKS